MPSGAATAVPLLPEVISRIAVAPSIVTPTVNVLAALPTVTDPALTVSPPRVVPMTPVSDSAPAPALVMLKVGPEIAPPTVSVLALTVIVRDDVLMVTAPVPTFRAWVPVKVKLPFHD